MKTNLFKLCCLLAAPFFFCANAGAQETSDFGSWSSIQIIKPIGKVYAMARAEHRSYDNMGATECYFGMAGAGYKFTPWLKGDLSYEYWQIPVSSLPTTHKGVACLTATLKRDALSVSLREKYELAFNVGGASGKGTMRSRIRAQYDFEKSGLTPYFMYEYFNGFSGSLWQRSLHYFGTEIKLGGPHSLDLFYMYHLYPKATSVACCHLLGIGYVLVL